MVTLPAPPLSCQMEQNTVTALFPLCRTIFPGGLFAGTKAIRQDGNVCLNPRFEGRDITRGYLCDVPLLSHFPSCQQWSLERKETITALCSLLGEMLEAQVAFVSGKKKRGKFIVYTEWETNMAEFWIMPQGFGDGFTHFWMLPKNANSPLIKCCLCEAPKLAHWLGDHTKVFSRCAYIQLSLSIDLVHLHCFSWWLLLFHCHPIHWLVLISYFLAWP